VRRRYNSFLIRYWSLDDEQGERAEVTHLQSGERRCVVSLAEALALLRDYERGVATSQGALPHGQLMDSGVDT
jgi:hypothetical protein